MKEFKKNNTKSINNLNKLIDKLVKIAKKKKGGKK